MAGSSDKDLEIVCEDLRKIEKDLAFEVTEAYKDRRMEDFRRAYCVEEPRWGRHPSLQPMTPCVFGP